MATLGWPAIASNIYFLAYFLLFVTISYYVHKTEEFKNKISFLIAIWKREIIYGQILLHLYDTATDFGVLIEWYILAQDENNGIYDVDSLNMNTLFWTSVAFIILYRLLSAIVGCVGANGIQCKFFDGCILGICDMYIMKTVYIAIKDDKEEATPKQRMIQLGESIFESLPQMVLQSVFIIRVQNDEELRNQSSMNLVGLSLLASLLSVTFKFVWSDSNGVEKGKDAAWAKPSCFTMPHEDNTKDLEVGSTETVDVENNIAKRGCLYACKNDWHGKDRIGCVNEWYVLRVIWRFSYIVTKFAIWSLIWSVLGGAFIGIFMGLSFAMWYALILKVHVRSKFESTRECCTTLSIAIPSMAIVSLAGSFAYRSYLWAIAHAIEVLTLMSIITWFAFYPWTECGICASSEDRQANDNDFILSFIRVGWLAMVIDFASYFILLKYKIFNKEMGGFYSVRDNIY